MKQREITGSLFERNGKYTAILNLYDENGKRKQKSIALGIPVKGNKRKAQARLEELKREYSTPAPQLARARVDSPLFGIFSMTGRESRPPPLNAPPATAMKVSSMPGWTRSFGSAVCGCVTLSPSTSGNYTNLFLRMDAAPIRSFTTMLWSGKFCNTP